MWPQPAPVTTKTLVVRVHADPHDDAVHANILAKETPNRAHVTLTVRVTNSHVAKNVFIR
jgi:hypothetical protein